MDLCMTISSASYAELFCRHFDYVLHGGQELHIERAAMARMGFLDKAEELDIMIEAERTRLKKVISTSRYYSVFTCMHSAIILTCTSLP